MAMASNPKNIVICCDGTGQSYHGSESNVLRLYRLALKGAQDQIAAYDPGVGTHPLPNARTRSGRAWRHYAGELLLGRGVMESVSLLYRYLMEHYDPGDRIFLIGFSRGAFTVRALAGLLHVCGLLRRDDTHLIPYATGLYQTSESRIGEGMKRASSGEPLRHTSKDHAEFDGEAGRFKALLSRDIQIAFLGVWDTVKAYGWMRPQSFPALRHNPSVAVVRHAVALDERRAVFQMTGWGDRHSEVKEAWFAGDHSDVGGGHPCNSPLADAAMNWMLGEAVHAGLLLEPGAWPEVNRIVENSRSACRTAPNNLFKGWFRLPFPRVELDNSTYPPARRLEIRATGVRKPAAHVEPAAYETREGQSGVDAMGRLRDRPRVLLHHSVRERQEREPAYRKESLFGGGREVRGVRASEIDVEYEEDRKISKDASYIAGAQ